MDSPRRAAPLAAGRRPGYLGGVRPRWPEYVIVLCLVLLFAAGVAAIWGGDLVDLFRSADR